MWGKRHPERDGTQPDVDQKGLRHWKQVPRTYSKGLEAYAQHALDRRLWLGSTAGNSFVSSNSPRGRHVRASLPSIAGQYVARSRFGNINGVMRLISETVKHQECALQ